MSASADGHQITIEAQSSLRFHRLARNNIFIYLSTSLWAFGRIRQLSSDAEAVRGDALMLRSR